jgi:beta-N-acetylhexosaminidase
MLSGGHSALGARASILTLALGASIALSACGQATSIHLVSAPHGTRSTRPAGDIARSAPAGNGGTAAPKSPARHSVTAGDEKPGPAPLSISRAIGQMLMSHVTGLTAPPQLLARVRDGRVGSVILYSENIAGDEQLSRLTSSLQAAARAGGNPPLLIGTDQEGGSVKRLRNSPPTLSARQMGSSADPFSVAESQGRATGLHLRRLGINLDFAPVSDIPTSSDNFLQDRAFGRSQQAVVEGAGGFAQGLAAAHVAASAKHFPGLGDAGTRDSDFTLVSISASKAVLQEAYAPYLAMAQLGADVAPMVMISDASYPALDPSGLPAVLSKKIIQSQLAVAGISDRVTITDDLEVPSTEQFSDTPVKAVLAGDDVLMFAQRESGSERAFQAIASAVANHAIPRSTVIASATKVIALKHALGLD